MLILKGSEKSYREQKPKQFGLIHLYLNFAMEHFSTAVKQVDPKLRGLKQ
jgi:hypothetical protein